MKLCPFCDNPIPDNAWTCQHHWAQLDSNQRKAIREGSLLHNKRLIDDEAWQRVQQTVLEEAKRCAS